MKTQISRLYEISNKPARRIIGLMSGTSLDGLDIAVCLVAGHGSDTKLKLEHFKTFVYEEEFKSQVRKIFSKQTVDLELLTLLNKHIAIKHAGLVMQALNEWNISSKEIDVIASHGQTIYHAPFSLHGNKLFGSATLQLGDGDHIAVSTGIITISDFRQKHIAAGGEGAPLAAYGDYFLFKEKDSDVILLNIGGISNISFLPADLSQDKIFSTDLGPGNTIMDAYTQQNFGEPFDKDSLIAKAGLVNNDLLTELKNHSFLKAPLPRTTGPELFNLEYLQQAMSRSGTATETPGNVMATLNRFTADIIIENLEAVRRKNNRTVIYPSGGGIHNVLLMQTIRESFPGLIWKSTGEKNIDPDAKEAVLFALLANETLAGNVDQYPGSSASFPAVSMGKISFPR